MAEVNVAGGGPSSQERTWGMLCHLLAFAGIVIPFGHIIGPLVMWLIKKDESAFVDYHGKEALNFQITVTLASIVSMLLIFIVIGIPLLILVWLANIVFIILATIAANRGEYYRYPVALRLIK